MHSVVILIHNTVPIPCNEAILYPHFIQRPADVLFTWVHMESVRKKKLHVSAYEVIHRVFHRGTECT